MKNKCFLHTFFYRMRHNYKTAEMLGYLIVVHMYSLTLSGQSVFHTVTLYRDHTGWEVKSVHVQYFKCFFVPC